MKHINVPNEVQTAQVLFASHSGGKDSQAMLNVLIRLGFKGRVVLVHSDLGEMEWEEMRSWIESISHGITLHVVKASEDFFDLVKRTGFIPSGHMQFCTDVLKTQPICEFIHAYMYEHNLTTAINVTGMRAQESKRRAAKLPFTLSQGKETSGMNQPKKHPTHQVFDWMPLFDYSELEVFAEIANAGQEPHWLYSQGFSRLSCVFCVNGRVDEHQKASQMRPELALKIANLEREIGKTYRMKQVKGVKLPKFMDEYLTGLPPQFEAIL